MGFVTVTDVKTSADLRHARVYVSVLGSRCRACGQPRGTVVRPRVSCRVASRKSCTSSTPRSWTSSSTTPPSAPHRLERLIDRLGAGRVSVETVADTRQRVLDEIRDGERFMPRHARAPRRRRARLARRDARRAPGARQGLGHVHGRRRVPAALRVPLLRLRRARLAPAGRLRRAHGDLPRLRQHRPQPAGGRQARGRAHPQPRPPPRQHALRHGQPRRRGRLVHGRDRLGPDAPTSASRRRRRSPMRCTSAWSPTPAASCTRTPASART